MSTEELLQERLARIEAALMGVERIENQLAAFNKPFESRCDLGRDLSLLMDPAVRKLTEEMVEVEIGFQLGDFLQFLEKLVDMSLEVDLAAAKPVGLWSMLRQMRRPDCRQGLGVMLELTRALGKMKTGPAEMAA